MPARLLHLTDLHTTSTHRPLPALTRLVAADTLPAAAVVITGDLIQRGHASAYPLLAADLRELARFMPVVTVLGNHDEVEPARILPGHRPAHVRIVDVGTVRIVALDSTRFDADQLAFTDAALDTDHTVVIAMHHPPFPHAIPDLIGSNFAAVTELAPVIAGRAHLILSGHYHQAGAGQFAGVGVWVGPALSYQRAVTPGWRETALTSLQFSVVDLTPTGYQVGSVHLELPAPVVTRVPTTLERTP